MPNLKLLASAVAEIIKRNPPNFRELPQDQSYVHFLLSVISWRAMAKRIYMTNLNPLTLSITEIQANSLQKVEISQNGKLLSFQTNWPHHWIRRCFLYSTKFLWSDDYRKLAIFAKAFSPLGFLGGPGTCMHAIMAKNLETGNWDHTTLIYIIVFTCVVYMLSIVTVRENSRRLRWQHLPWALHCLHGIVHLTIAIGLCEIINAMVTTPHQLIPVIRYLQWSTRCHWIQTPLTTRRAENDAK